MPGLAGALGTFAFGVPTVLMSAIAGVTFTLAALLVRSKLA